jgi:photosystem II stability/assembly factor-like uncharacterized protein
MKGWGWLPGLGLVATACLAMPSAALGEDAIREARPALSAELAARSILIDLAQAGEHYLAVGERGHILRSADGRGWQQVEVPVDVMLNRVWFLDERRGWAVGHDGAILHTQDGGQSWVLQRWAPDDRELNDVRFTDADNGIAIGGYGTLLETSDGGESWEMRDIDIAILGGHFNRIIELGNRTLFMVGERGLLSFSQDDGDSWQLVDSPYTGSFFGALPHGDKGVLVYGLRGNVFVADDVNALRTMDPMDWDEFERETVTDADALSTLGWTFVETPKSESLFGGVMHEGEAWLVGVNGVVVRVNPATRQARAAAVPDLDTLAAILPLADGWLLAGRRGVHRLDTIRNSEASPGEILP